MDEIHYKSKSEMKRIQRQLEHDDFLRQRKEKEITDRWEQAQLKAATMQSVLDYMVEQYEAHKEELDKEIVSQTEEQIKQRRSEIEDFLMTEQKICAEALEDYNKTI